MDSYRSDSAHSIFRISALALPKLAPNQFALDRVTSRRQLSPPKSTNSKMPWFPNRQSGNLWSPDPPQIQGWIAHCDLGSFFRIWKDSPGSSFFLSPLVLRPKTGTSPHRQWSSQLDSSWSSFAFQLWCPIVRLKLHTIEFPATPLFKAPYLFKKRPYRDLWYLKILSKVSFWEAEAGTLFTGRDRGGGMPRDQGN